MGTTSAAASRGVWKQRVGVAMDVDDFDPFGFDWRPRTGLEG